MSVDDWRFDAACRGVHPRVFFGTRDGEPTTARAKAICAVCPVLAQCLTYAIDNRVDFGVWGGMTAQNRRTEARRRRKAAA